MAFFLLFDGPLLPIKATFFSNRFNHVARIAGFASLSNGKVQELNTAHQFPLASYGRMGLILHIQRTCGAFFERRHTAKGNMHA